MTHADRLRVLWTSGDLQRLATEHATMAGFEAAIGLTRDQMRTGRATLAREGVIVPGWLELRGGSNTAPVHVVPTGHVMKGVSTLVGPDGEIKQQWIKTSQQDDERQVWLDALANMGGTIPRAEPVAAPSPSTDTRMAAYMLGDPHVGMLAWSADAGENFDLSIAEAHIVGAITLAAALAPDCDQALLVTVGDTTHSDGQNNTTTKGTRVDVDGRTAKMVSTTLRIFRRSIAILLAKHKRVRVIVERGNHDELLSLLIAIALGQHYENDPRVEIDLSPQMFHFFRFGRVLLMTHHGHNVKPMDLLGVMAVDRAEDWAECLHRVTYCGHYHHAMTKEVPGMIVHFIPTLAGSDAWHASMGYRSGRAMYLDIYDATDGMVQRHVIGIEQVKRLAA